MHVEHAYPIVTSMAESRPEEAVVASRYNFRVVTTGQEFVSVSDYPTCMVRGPSTLYSLSPLLGTLCGDRIPPTWHPICLRGGRSQAGISLDRAIEVGRSAFVTLGTVPKKGCHSNGEGLY